MPKLNKKMAGKVDEQEVQDFTAIPGGSYRCALEEVEVRNAAADGAEYWSWKYRVISDADGDESYADRRLWVNTSLKDNALWKMKEVFEAHGYTPDSDTDEIIGEEALLIVSQRVIPTGQRQGQMGNNVDKVLPVDEADGAGAAAAEDDVF